MNKGISESFPTKNGQDQNIILAINPRTISTNFHLVSYQCTAWIPGKWLCRLLWNSFGFLFPPKMTSKILQGAIISDSAVVSNDKLYFLYVLWVGIIFKICLLNIHTHKHFPACLLGLWGELGGVASFNHNITCWKRAGDINRCSSLSTCCSEAGGGAALCREPLLARVIHI